MNPITVLPAEDPDQPQAAGHQNHEAVEQEVTESILALHYSVPFRLVQYGRQVDPQDANNPLHESQPVGVATRCTRK
jgi:hypothetical protein